VHDHIKQNRNSYQTTGVTTVLTITRASGEQISYTFDTDQKDKVQHHCWRYDLGFGGAVSGCGDRAVTLGRLLTGHDGRQHVKHINDDRSDFRLMNLRVGRRPDLVKVVIPKPCVTFCKSRKQKWRQFQAFTCGKGRRSIGYFTTFEAAAGAVKSWIKENNWKPEKPGRKVGWRKHKGE
jgi:hypothetical protein